MRSRRVVLNDPPNSNTRTGTGTYRGKTAPVPMYDLHSWRNPGGPVIRQQAMQLQSQIMRENTRILMDVQDVTSDASIHTPAATSTP